MCIYMAKRTARMKEQQLLDSEAELCTVFGNGGARHSTFDEARTLYQSDIHVE